MLAALLRHRLLLQAAVSVVTALLSVTVHLPSLILHGLHTYVYPDQPPSGDGARLAIRRPSASDDHQNPPGGGSKRKNRSSGPAFDESKAQLLRLGLSHSHLHSRLFFTGYNTAFLSSIVAVANFAVVFLVPPEAEPSPASTATTAVAAFVASGHLLFLLARLSFERSASRRLDRQLALLIGIFGFPVALLLASSFSPSIFDFELGAAAVATSVVAGALLGLLFVPTTRVARAFWLGTDQLRWNLAVVTCGTFGRILLYTSVLTAVLAPLFWVVPVAVVAAGGDIHSAWFKEFRVWVLMASAILQLVALRQNVQMYLNESIVCWYQRLHIGRVADMDYGRAKVFLINHYLCLVVLQFFAPPTMVLLLLGLSQIRGNLFSGIFLFGSLANCSDVVKEMALFLAWWIAFVWSIFTMINLTLYRYGFLILS